MSINIILNTIIHILILVLLFSFFINNKNDNNTIIFILCAITVFLCYMIEFIKNPDIMKLNVEKFQSPINPKSIGPYNKLDLNVDEHGKYNKNYIRNTPNSKCGWRKEPCDTKLLEKIKFTSPIGLEKRFIQDPDHSKTFPTVDGTKDGFKSMFMFANNQCHPDCCPSTYSCDHGCVCTNKQQREFLNKRGKNRSTDVYPGI